MSTRNRSQELAADLLHDLAEDDAAPAATAAPVASTTRVASAVPVASAAADEIAPTPSAFVETALFLAPSTWRRPRLVRSAALLSLSAGPVQVRVGRR